MLTLKKVLKLKEMKLSRLMKLMEYTDRKVTQGVPSWFIRPKQRTKVDVIYNTVLYDLSLYIQYELRVQNELRNQNN